MDSEKKIISRHMSEAGKKGYRAAKKKVTHAQRVAWGKQGGRPRLPDIEALMKRDGISRQLAHYRLRGARARMARKKKQGKK